MTLTDKDEANRSEIPTILETPAINPDAEMNIINLINDFDARSKYYLYNEKEKKLIAMPLPFGAQKRTTFYNELHRVKTMGQFRETYLFKKHPSLACQKWIILLPYAPISRSHIPTETYSEREINQTKIINTFWKSELSLRYEAAEALILVCSFLAKNVDRNTLGLGISKTKMAVILGMSVRRVSDTLKRLKELGYVRLYTEETKRGNLSLGTFVQVTEAFSSQFFVLQKPVGESEKKQQKSSEPQSQDSPEKRYFQFLEILSDLRLDLKNFIVNSEEPIPPVVLQQIFKVL
ncbi:hypothetical protein [Vibrio cincinnatiensis]|uniref:hypothetical protein n=1 Tax=Vibrio cincinnatiensis TaxID=675 RepID=UPI001302BCA2|nr:hypothetical protein [Vibrio cincinnatiensis]